MTQTDHQERLLKRYQHLVEIALDLASTLNLDALLNRIAEVAVELSGCQAASILLYDEKTAQLFFNTATNMDELPMIRGMQVPSEGSLAGWVIKNRKAVVVGDVQNDIRHYELVDDTLQFQTASLLAIPMITKDKVIGVLEVVNKVDGIFTQEDQDILAVLGAQAAVAIENTRLFQQSDLISELVHELRTPISSMCAVAFLLQKANLPEAQRIKLAETIYSESMRLNEMATSFLDVARLESGRAQFQYARIEIAPLIRECNTVVENDASARQIVIHEEITSDLPRFEADRDRLKRVLLNLLNNAIKYNRPGGLIILRAFTEQKEMVIEVEDNGIGVPADAIPHLFEKFFRVKSTEKTTGGTGLGLSICKQIIETHRGRIDVTSVINQGTKFTIRLPLLQT
jgi:signal transduction histidine kinase